MASLVSEDFVSVKFDIARFGSMIYEVISGIRYEIYVTPDIEADLDDDPEVKTFKAWPAAERVPDAKNVFLGDIIEKCWLEDGFLSMQDVCHALDNADQRLPLISPIKHSVFVLSFFLFSFFLGTSAL